MSVVVDPSQQQQKYSVIINKLILTKDGVLHSHFIKTALILTSFLSNRLIQLYSKCISNHSAHTIFEDMPDIWVITKWAALSDTPFFEENEIGDWLCRHGWVYHCWSGWSICFFQSAEAVAPSSWCVSYYGVEGIMNALVDANGKCGGPPDVAYDVFKRISDKDTVSWTSIVAAFMCTVRIEDDSWVFHHKPYKSSTISWTSLIAGLVQNGCRIEALNMFLLMLEL